MEKKSISAHEPQAALLSAKDVDADVVSLSEALIEEQARNIARKGAHTVLGGAAQVCHEFHELTRNKMANS